MTQKYACPLVNETLLHVSKLSWNVKVVDIVSIVLLAANGWNATPGLVEIRAVASLPLAIFPFWTKNLMAALHPAGDPGGATKLVVGF